MFRGLLSERPLPEILLTVHRYRAPGVIECHDGAATRLIIVEEGSIVSVTSDAPEESLGARLCREGRISPEQLAELTAAEGEETFAAIDRGYLQPRELFQAVRQRAIEILRAVSEQAEGEVSFRPGRDHQIDGVRFNLPIRQAVVEVLREVQDARKYLTRLGSRHTILEKSETADLADVACSPDELALLQQIDGTKTLSELTALPPMPATRNALTLYAFHLLGAVVPKAAKQIKVQVRTTGDALGE